MRPSRLGTLLAVLAVTGVFPGGLTNAPAGRLAAAELSKEDSAKVGELYRESRSARTLKEYAKSNSHLEQILGMLPKPVDTKIEPNFARLHYDLAANHALLGDKAKALDHLARAVEFGFWDHDFLSRDDSLKSLRSEKTFAEILGQAHRGVAEVAFGLDDLSGKKLRKEDFKGKVVVIDVWGTWCPPCRAEIPSFVALQKKYGGQGLAMIGLVWEKRPPDASVKSRVEKFISDNGVSYPNVLAQPAVITSIPRLNSFPTTFYIGRDGRIAERVSGMEPYEEIERRVLKLLAEKPPAASETAAAK